MKSGVNSLLKPSKTAKLLAISERTLWQLTKEKQIPSLRIGNSVRYDFQEVMDWLKKNRDENRDGE